MMSDFYRAEMNDDLHKINAEAAMAAWEHYQATDLHVTAEEADAWLAKLEAGVDTDPPECHC